MEVELANIFFSWLLHVDLTCIVCNWDPASQSWVPYTAGGLGAAAGTGLGLNDLFQETGDGGFEETSSGGVGDTANPTYSDTTADDNIAANNDRIAASELAKQRQNENYRATHPGATTAGPSQPTLEEQGGRFFHRGVRKRIMGE
ncbi:MAG TPA: hypothetical protein VJB57_16510 [Dehalococcoidia bacterium]|nr:hypothetical protein [Dehalococcoidia bacterium]